MFTFYTFIHIYTKFELPGCSTGKESACNAGNPSWIPGSGRSLGEGIGYPLQYSWSSLVAQMVKNLPAMQDIWVQSLAQEDPLEERVSTHSSILAWRIPMDRGAWQATWGRKELDTTKRLRTHTHTAETNTILYSNYPLIKNE